MNERDQIGFGLDDIKSGFATAKPWLEKVPFVSSLVPLTEYGLNRDLYDVTGSVTYPDFVVISGKVGNQILSNITKANVFQGKRFAGNGYQKGDRFGSKFSFGYDAPKKVDLYLANGEVASVIEIEQIFFGGGIETLAPQKEKEMKTGVFGELEAVVKNMSTSEISMPEALEPIEVSNDTYIHGVDVQVGATPIAPKKAAQRAGYVFKKTPGGRTHTSLQTSKPKTDAAAIKNAKDVAKRSDSIAKKATKVLKTGATKVRGLDFDYEMLGATAPSRARAAFGGVKKKPLLTDASLKKLATDVEKAAGKLNKGADNHGTVVLSQKAALSKGAQNVRDYLNSRTSVKGYDDFTTDFGYYQDIADDVCGQATEDAGEAQLDSMTLSAEGGPDGNFGMGAPPTLDTLQLQSGIDYIADPHPDGIDGTIFDTKETDYGGDERLPLGAVVYDGSRPIPPSGAGSLTRFNGGAREVEPGAYGYSGFEWRPASFNSSIEWFWFIEGAYNFALSDLRYKNMANDDGKMAGMLSGPARAERSKAWGWGPLIGNPLGVSPPKAPGNQVPVDGWVKGLRYDKGSDRWFWYYDKAPDWAQANVKQKILSKAMLEWNTELQNRKAEYLNQQILDKLEREKAEAVLKQQAAEDAEHARRLQKEKEVQDLKAAAEQPQIEREQRAQELARSQQELEMAKLEQQFAMSQMELEKKMLEQGMMPYDDEAAYESEGGVFTPMFTDQGAPIDWGE